MKDLNSINDEDLLDATKKLVRKEQEILSQILRHFREIERRRLYSKLKFGSLYEYATKELGYSEDQAYRRIQAMRLLKELPEIEEKVIRGTLNLTHLGMAQSLFKRKEKSGERGLSREEKVEVLDQLENTSKREAEKIALNFSTLPVIPIEKIRTVSAGDVEIRFTAKEALLKKIQKLKGLLAHKSPHLQLSELIDQLCDLGLEKWDESLTAPARGTKRQQTDSQKLSRVQLRREIWRRDKGRCQICSSSYALEIDHKLPKAMGGEDLIENLRLLCRSCNQREAISWFGIQKMERYIDA